MNDREVETIFWTFQPAMVQFASRKLDKETAESVVSDSFVTLWKKKNIIFPTTEEEMTSLGALLFSILRGKINNEHRAQARRNQLISKLVFNAPAEPKNYDDTATTLTKIMLAGWLTQLSEEDQIIVEFFQYGFTNQYIGQILGISADAVRKRRDRLIKRLREIALENEEVN